MTLLMSVTAAVLAACGTFLMLGRELSRVVIGVGMLSHGANLLLVLSGGRGGEPAFAGGDPDTFSDPLPQAFVLTAIVITFGVIAFLLALAFRSWLVTDDDAVEDDVEDRLIARRTEREAREEQAAQEARERADRAEAEREAMREAARAATREEARP